MSFHAAFAAITAASAARNKSKFHAAFAARTRKPLSPCVRCENQKASFTLRPLQEIRKRLSIYFKKKKDFYD
jgi:cytidine deaminase